MALSPSSSGSSAGNSTPTTLPERDALAVFFVLAAMGVQLWDLPTAAAQHGGWAFVAAWALCLLGLGVPVLLTELLLGRRAQRAPIEGMAALTREADARRVWRIGAWASLAAALLAMALAALLAGGNANFVARNQHVAAAWLLPAVAGFALLKALGVAWCGVWRARAVNAVALLALVLLAAAAVAGAGAAAGVYQAAALSAGDWREAVRLALLSAGVGMGAVWMVGAQSPKTRSASRVAVAAISAQLVAAVLMLLALAPYVSAALVNARVNAAAAGLAIAPTGAAMLALQAALVLIAVAAIAVFAAPVLAWLGDKKIARGIALPAVFLAAAALAAAVWFGAQAGGVQCALKAASVLVLAVVLVQNIFAGWVMKISHARKELALPNELIYNLWRVLVRLAVPLAVMLVLLRVLSA